MAIREIVKTRVYPEELIILEADLDNNECSMIHIHPEYYDVKIVLSPKIVLKILRWMIREHYIRLNGTLYFKYHSKVGNHYVTTKEETITT